LDRCLSYCGWRDVDVSIFGDKPAGDDDFVCVVKDLQRAFPSANKSNDMGTNCLTGTTHAENGFHSFILANF